MLREAAQIPPLVTVAQPIDLLQGREDLVQRLAVGHAAQIGGDAQYSIGREVDRIASEGAAAAGVGVDLGGAVAMVNEVAVRPSDGRQAFSRPPRVITVKLTNNANNCLRLRVICMSLSFG